MHFSCRVVPSGSLALSGGDPASQQRGVVTITSDALVYCPDPNLKNIFSFQMDSAFGPTTPAADFFRAAVQPLVTTALRGQNATCVVCGDDEGDKVTVAEGRRGWDTRGTTTSPMAVFGRTERLTCCRPPTLGVWRCRLCTQSPPPPLVLST